MRNPNFLLSGSWTAIVAAIAGIVDLEATARVQGVAACAKDRYRQGLVASGTDVRVQGGNRFGKRRFWPETPVLPI
jgi:hypothetical protein